LAAHRLVFSDPPELDISCSAIKKRNFFQTRAASAEELEFPVARARIVYKVGFKNYNQKQKNFLQDLCKIFERNIDMLF
jgi:hypothetical protein